MRRSAGLHKGSQLGVAFDGTLHVDSPGFCFALAELAKARDLQGICMCSAMRSTNGVAERALPLASPHNAVQWIAAHVIFCQRMPKRLYFGVMETQSARFLARERDLLQSVNALQVTAKNVFVPTESFHAAGLGFRNDASENVEARMVRSSDVLQRSVCVVLLVSASEVPAVKLGVVFLFAMVRQRPAGNLAAGNASAIAEGRDK